MTPPTRRHLDPVLSSVWITAAFAYIYIAWGATYLAIHFALQGMPPLLLAGARFAIAGLVLLLFLRLAHASRFHGGSFQEWKDAAVVGTLLLVFGNGTVAWSQQFVPSSVTALLFGSIPMWIVLFDWLRPKGTVPTLRTCAGLVLGLIGVATLVHPTGSVGISSQLFWGELALIGAAFSWAAGSIYSRHVHAQGSPLLPMARQMIVGGAMLLLGSALHGDWNRFSLRHVSGAAWLGFLYLVLFGSLLGFTIYVWLMRVSTPERVATISYVNLVVAVLLGGVVLHEPVTARLVLGAAVIMASVLVVLKKPKAPADVPSD